MEVAQAGSPPTRKVLRRGNEFRLIAEERRKRIDIVPGLIPSSSLLLVSALPQGGKTSFFSQITGSLTSARPCFGRPVSQQTPVIWLNADFAGEDFFLDQAEKSWTTGAQEAFDQWFFDVQPDCLEDTVSKAFLEECIANARQEVGCTTPGVLVVDTLRNAFLRNERDGAENDSGTMSRILRPVRELTRKSGWTILLSAHSSKGSGRYAGSTAIMASCDGELSLQRHSLNINRIDVTVSIRGLQPALLRLEDTDSGLMLLDEKVGAQAGRVAIQRLVESLPNSRSSAKTDVELEAANPGMKKTKIKTTLLSYAETRQFGVCRIGEGKKGDPHRFYRESEVSA